MRITFGGAFILAFHLVLCGPLISKVSASEQGESGIDNKSSQVPSMGVYRPPGAFRTQGSFGFQSPALPLTQLTNQDPPFQKADSESSWSTVGQKNQVKSRPPIGNDGGPSSLRNNGRNNSGRYNNSQGGTGTGRFNDDQGGSGNWSKVGISGGSFNRNSRPNQTSQINPSPNWRASGAAEINDNWRSKKAPGTNNLEGRPLTGGNKPPPTSLDDLNSSMSNISLDSKGSNKWDGYRPSRTNSRFYNMKTGQSWGPPLFDYDTLIKYAKLPATHKRYIIIGDVHGQLDDLNKLLKKVSFNMSEDLIILAGDLVNKGQDSLGVVRLAQKIGAKCVRGNHENYLYSIRKEIQLKQPSKKWKDAQVSLTNQMDINDWKYLDSCPLVLELPDLDEKVVVAHAGVDANAPIDDQDPNFTMYVPHMPNLKVANKYYTAHENWQEEWAQKHSQDGMTGVYGHTELKTLDIRPLAKGIDTSCYLGGELTANIYPGDEIVSVKCTDYNKQEKPEATPLLE
ncbi:hypothetical protein H4R33_006429 [Dimargaris cristalligena]|nr:hypothetical protein H4R33_006429 [Dimargaris cristalligena]